MIKKTLKHTATILFICVFAFGILIPTQTFADTTIIQDGFSGTGSSTLGGRSPDTVDNGNDWVDGAGGASAFKLNAGGTRAVYTASGGYYKGENIDVGYDDYTVSVDVIVPTTLSFLYGIPVRVSATNTYMLAFMEQDAGGNAYLMIYSITGDPAGSSVAGPLDLGARYDGGTRNLRVVMSGANISFTVDGSSALTYGSAPSTGGVTGIWTYVDGLTPVYNVPQAEFDNFLVTVAGGASATIYPEIIWFTED